LRSKLTIIPQDPILFDGTLRSNLDPFNKHSDKELWDALKLTHVLESMQDEDCLTLESMVSENGNNFSQGQRQLLCLARALLRKSKLIFMDEATASVDPDTDAKIQQTIRSEMIHGTVLTVAHRLKTIIDYDQVIVMDGGIVAEMGSPLELLSQEGSIFHKMCEESGDCEELYEIASFIN
ncbi:P-loop containing nucleoside triphosphate hydrolase protein, partial [Globomyces pollinis-pini]